jgi:hypothetical protein
MAWTADDIADAVAIGAAVARIIRRHSQDVSGHDLSIAEHVRHDVEALHRHFDADGGVA